MKKLLILSVLLLAACAPPPPYFVERFVPTTEAEHKAVVEMEEKLLGNVPRTLGGHDQDLDDAILAAHKAALQACCRPTYWERALVAYETWEFTGVWHYAEQH